MDRAGSFPSQRLLDVLEQLFQITGADLKATLLHVSDVLARVSGADKVDAFLYDGARDSLVALGSSTQPLSMLQRELGLDVLPVSNGGRVVQVFKTGDTFRCGRLDEDAEELPGIKEALKVKSHLAVPLEVGGERRGVVLLASLHRDFFTEEDARFIETVARWVSMATHRAELAGQITRAAAEQGRRAGAEELVTVLAHDLRNYLMPLHMRLNILRLRAEADRREDELRDLDLLGKSIDRLGALVNDILDVSRIDAGLFHLVPQRVELSALVREVVGALQSAQHAFNLTVQQGDDVHVAGDPRRLRQCLENVLANAIQKSPPTAIIHVFVRREERQGRPRCAVVEIIDEGPGIPPEQLPHVFEPYRSSREGGLGLGLYIAKRIAAMHNGDLSAASPPGKGARFTLKLPLEA